MTINPSRTRELNLAKMAQRAYQLCGLANEAQNISNDKLVFALDFIEMIIAKMEAEGIRARAVAFEEVTMVEGQSEYLLSSDAIDVVGVGMYIDPSETDLDHAGGEIPVIPISREDRQLQVAKDATGRPIQFQADRSTYPVTVWVWPTPTAQDEGTIRFQIHRWASNSNVSSYTVDLEKYWTLYITWELAHHLAVANTLNMGRVSYFAQVAAKHLENCKSYSAQKPAAQFSVGHRTPWSNR